MCIGKPVHMFYHCQTLLQWRNQPENSLPDEVLQTLLELSLLRDPGLQPAVFPDAGAQRKCHRKRCERKRKRGKRAGIRVRLKASPSRPAIPSLFLANVCSLDNKLDYIRLQRTTQREFRDCCVLFFVESWLNDNIPDIKTQLPSSLDPLQFAYRPNRSTDDAITTTLHLSLTHLEKKDTYVRMLFIDFSSAFNTIIPQNLTRKLSSLGLNTPLCNWILDFLTGRPQSVRFGGSTSSTITLNTGAPQGSVLSPLLFTLLTHDCAAKHSSNSFIKFADDTTVLGLITKGDESAYREEVQRLTDWCTVNNLHLNVDKTKEMVVDGSSVEIVKSTKFLGVHLADNLTWTLNTSSTAKKAQQRFYFLRKLRKARLPPPILTLFYRGTIESILSSCITAWFGTCTVSDRKTLQRIVRTAERIIGVSLLSITDIYTTRSIRKATSIVNDPTHPSHKLFSLLPSGRRYRSIRSSTTRFCNSFYPQAIRLLNCRD
uniref:Reverse transcriptase domain-containing protein n=1 Tax=Astyanax mexicanus TaxID=7994 RepID=A0A3B1IU70_ASTMX